MIIELQTAWPCKYIQFNNSHASSVEKYVQWLLDKKGNFLYIQISYESFQASRFIAAFRLRFTAMTRQQTGKIPQDTFSTEYCNIRIFWRQWNDRNVVFFIFCIFDDIVTVAGSVIINILSCT